MTTLNLMILELSTWVTFSAEELAAAKASDINTKNSNGFRAFVAEWAGGAYDEDPISAQYELKYFLKKVA